MFLRPCLQVPDFFNVTPLSHMHATMTDFTYSFEKNYNKNNQIIITLISKIDLIVYIRITFFSYHPTVCFTIAFYCLPYSSDFCPTYVQNLPDLSALIFFCLPRTPMLGVNDIAFIPNITTPESIQVHIKQSKTDTLRRGTALAFAKSHCSVCAVTALQEYTYCNGTQITLRYPSLQNGEPLIRTLLNANLRELSNILGYLENEYASHSFRIRATTTAAAAKLPCTIANQNT